MVRLSSANRVNEAKQVEKVFEELTSNIADVDFDLPPVLKEWKLSYYVPIKRNVYLTKRRIEDDGIFCSCLPSGSLVACGKDCQCGMLFSCCSSDCKCDSACANKSFQHRPLKQTRLIKTEKCGSGLVAEDEIKKGEFVIEYVGEVIDDRTCEERLWKMRRQGHTNFYLCEVTSNMIIDATNKGNMSRFINHSCEPNTEMQKWSVDGETRVGIFALRDIKKGEELTYDYKFVQFGAGTSQAQPARKKRKTSCENCIGQFLRLWHPREKQYVACWVYDFNNETKIHTLQFCDHSLEKFNLKEEEWHFLPVDDESD
ncbi:hypothetical protein QOZ80_6AG0531630 [Eleusine coracana subsp. coracana]|nr:hypothetical protein QOZ80_6AG0531630 [Eleusine coracana subsp. coracana]